MRAFISLKSVDCSSSVWLSASATKSFSAASRSSTSGSLRSSLRSQYQSSTRSFPWATIGCGRRGATGGWGITATRMGSPERSRYGRPMPSDEKPHVYVPAGEAPPAELVTEDLEVGDGDEATAGSQVEVHYVGVSWRTRKQFDASWDRGDTFSFGLGAGQVIKGWDEGVAGMRVGGRRRIVIPPGKAYGRQGAGGVIGPDETLVFVVDLLGVS